MKYRVEIKLTSKFSESWFPGDIVYETIGVANLDALRVLEEVPAVREYRIVEAETGKVVHP